MRNQKTQDLVYLALFLTIIIVMSQVPWLGFIPLGFTNATIIHIPVIIAAIYFGKKLGVLTGLMFGLASLFTAYVRPSAVMDLFFQNPIVSILPRIAFAYLTVIIYQGLKGIVNPNVRVAITALFGSILHSILVVGTILLVHFNKTKTFVPAEGDAQTYTINFAILSGLLVIVISEAVISSIITTPIIRALNAKNKQDNINELIKD
ncbi:ECF transporter S component [Mycoplasmatota bacterium]|nr:ECF transporter S component [Mycoplasmatota bacterium]